MDNNDQFWFFDTDTHGLFIDIDRAKRPDNIIKVGTLEKTDEILKEYYYEISNKKSGEGEID